MHSPPSIRLASRQGFTLIEALIATALLGFSLVVMFGFHTQAVRSNKHARKMTNCTYLAQTQMERLLALPWNATNGQHADLTSGASDVTPSCVQCDDPSWLDLPASNGEPTPVNAANNTDTTYGQAEYYITWDLEDMDAPATWTRIRVRCQYYDATFNQWKGTTVSSFRFMDHE